MKVLIVTSSLSGGGTERVSVILANFLSRAGHNVSMVVLYLKGTTYHLDESIRLYKLPYLKANRKKSNIIQEMHSSIIDFFSLRKIIANNKIDVIISFCILPAILMLLLRKRMTIITTKRNYPPASPPLKFFFEKQIFKRSDAVVFQTMEQMLFYDKKICEKGIVIPNPLLENLLAPYKGERKKEVVTFCRLTKQKNLLMLIDGFVRFYKKFPEYKMVIYGNRERHDSSYKDILKKHIIEEKMEHIIEIKNFSHDIHNIIKDSACFVLTSDFEGMSNSMLEAMAIGLPVICTDCRGGGARAFIKNYENGILIPINDREALSQALEYIATNPEKAQQMGRNAIGVREALSVEKICRQWMNII